jgi:hypothetical protein
MFVIYCSIPCSHIALEMDGVLGRVYSFTKNLVFDITRLLLLF